MASRNQAKFTFTRALLVLLLLSVAIFPKGGLYVLPYWMAILPVLVLVYGLSLFSRSTLPEVWKIWHLSLSAGLAIFFYMYYEPESDMRLFWSSMLVNLTAIPMGVFAATQLMSLDQEFRYEKTLWLLAFTTCVIGIATFIASNVYDTTPSLAYINNIGPDESDISAKHNDRGFAIKATALYNNGNIFGISMVTLLPLIVKFSGWGAFLLASLAVAMSLSRTAYFGYLLFIMGRAAMGQRLRTKLLSAGITLAAIVAAFFLFMNYDEVSGMGIDVTLGGRVSEEGALFNRLDLFPDEEFRPISEMTYKSALENYGLIIGGFFVVWMTIPLIGVALTRRSHPHSPMKDWRVQCGLLYLIMAMVDGSFHFYPALIIYLLVCYFPQGQAQEKGVTA